MFTLTAVPVKFVGLLLLFAFTTAHEARAVLRADSPTARTSHVFHLLMSLIMLLMVPKSWWVPFRSVVPVPVSIGLMLLGALWFVWLAVRKPEVRAHAAGCALMFTAMVWHLSAMMVKMHAMTGMAPMSASTPMSGSGHAGMDHAGMDHGAMATPMPSVSASPMTHDHAAMASTGHDTLWWLAIIGLPLMAWLLWATIRALTTLFTRPGHRLHAANDFAMNFGMFWMSTGLLVPVLPFFTALAF